MNAIGIGIRKALLLSFGIAIVFSAVHALGVSLLEHKNIAVEHFMNIETALRSLFVFAVSLSIIFIYSKKSWELSTTLLALKESIKNAEINKAYYQRIFENANDGIFVLNTQTKILSVNTAFAQMHGYTMEEMKGMSLEDLDTPEASKLVPERMQRILTEDHLTFEVEHRHKCGRIVLLEVSANLISSLDGDIILCVHRDITERKKIEDIIQQKNVEFQRLTDNVHGLIYQFTRHADGKYTVPVASAGIKDIFGCSPEDVIESFDPIARVIHPDDMGMVIHDIEASAENLTFFSCEFRVQIPGKEIQYIYSQSTPEKLPDGSVTWFGFNTDITERRQIETDQKKMEAHLNESQKMEALGTLAGGVAHDFNNLLSIILGNVELARQDVGDNPPALESLREVDRASRRAKDLVQQILSFSRRQAIERKAMSLSLVVIESVRLLKSSFKKTDIRIHIGNDTPVVLADAGQINQILINLCGNAVQAMEGQSGQNVMEVRLESYTQSTTDEDLTSGLYALLSVSDNGPGISKEILPRIFEPFFTTKQVGKGTGLGLSVVHGILKAHGAIIRVESSGEGSIFRIYFPAIQEETTAERMTALRETSSHQVFGKRIIYIDDEEAIVFLMKRMLERKGFSVRGYTNPREAVQVVRADPNQFDLAVTDYNMPDMTGLEVARALREIRKDLPIVMASGYITEDLRQKASRLNVNELIYKPNTVDGLCEAVIRSAKSRG